MLQSMVVVKSQTRLGDRGARLQCFEPEWSVQSKEPEKVKLWVRGIRCESVSVTLGKSGMLLGRCVFMKMLNSWRVAWRIGWNIAYESLGDIVDIIISISRPVWTLQNLFKYIKTVSDRNFFKWLFVLRNHKLFSKFCRSPQYLYCGDTQLLKKENRGISMIEKCIFLWEIVFWW